MPIDKGTHQGKLCSKNLDESFFIIQVTGVLIEKTLMYIFSNYNSLKYNHARIQKVISEAGGPIMAQH